MEFPDQRFANPKYRVRRPPEGTSFSIQVRDISQFCGAVGNPAVKIERPVRSNLSTRRPCEPLHYARLYIKFAQHYMRHFDVV